MPRRAKGFFTVMALTALLLLTGLIPAMGQNAATGDGEMLLRFEGQRLELCLGQRGLADWQLPRGAASLDFAQVGEYIIIRVSVEKGGASPSETYFCLDGAGGRTWHIAGALYRIRVDASVKPECLSLVIDANARIEHLALNAPVGARVDGSVEAFVAVPAATLTGAVQTPVEPAIADHSTIYAFMRDMPGAMPLISLQDGDQ